LARQPGSAARPALEARFNVISLALPGYGDAAPEPVSFAETATRLAASIPDGAYVCGWSLGAMLALQIAAQSPQRTLAGLILVGATRRASSSARTGIQRKNRHCSTRFAQRSNTTPPARCSVSSRSSIRATRRRGDRPRAQRAASIGPAGRHKRTLLDGLAWLRDVDLRATIAAVATPALLIHGAHDPLMPLAAAQWLAANLSNAALKVMPDAAHAPFLHAPENFAKLIGEYCHAAARH
jgi:pimeloyl-[acyl-carrier protein] methyl ester esterase